MVARTHLLFAGGDFANRTFVWALEDKHERYWRPAS